MIPTGEQLRISSRLALNGRTTEKIFCSRMRRAISCEYCAPKSRTTMDWVSTDEFLRLNALVATNQKRLPRGTRRSTGKSEVLCVPCSYRTLPDHDIHEFFRHHDLPHNLLA